MNSKLAAQGFAAMGSEARLRVLKTIIRAGKEGLSVGELQQKTNIPASTLAHHLKFLSGASLLEQERSGRTTTNHAAFNQLESPANYILSECCADERYLEAVK